MRFALALLCLLSFPVWADDDFGDTTDLLITASLATPGESCKIERRLVTVSCAVDDWCTVTDTLHLAAGAGCGEAWRLEINRRSESFSKPTLAVRMKGKAPIQVGASECSKDIEIGWCFAGVPEAERMRFEFKVRATNSRTSDWPGMTMRHKRFSKQRERGTSRKGIALGLTPGAWASPPPTQVTASANPLHQYELVGRNFRGPQTLTSLDVADSPSGAAIVAKRSGDYGEEVRVRFRASAPFADVIYEKKGSLGFAGVGVDVSVESPNQGEPSVAGGVFADAWLLDYFGFSGGAEGSSAGRVGVRADAIVMTRARAPLKLVSMPSFGASAGVVTNVVPDVGVNFRLRGIVQFQYVGIHVGADLPLDDSPTRLIAGASFSL